MTGIVELYRKHKDLLSIYFKSEEEVAECEKRAEMGDDRAQRVMSLACDSRDQSVYLHKYNTVKGGLQIPVSESKYFTDYGILASDRRDLYHKNAQQSSNPDSLNFDASVLLGNRTCQTKAAQWYPPLIIRREKFLGNEEYQLKNESDKTFFYSLNPKGSLRFEISSNFDTLYPTGEIDWAADKSTHRTHTYTYDDKYLKALQTCAYAGDTISAQRLSSIYKQDIFHEVVTKKSLFGSTQFKSNPLYDSTKAKEWQRVAEHLEGKSATPLEKEKFLQDFLYSQDKTPDGLYNIGYALYHNEKIGDKERGLDYLKHAANLGDANAARELGEIFQDRFDAKGEQSDLMTAHLWYKAGAELGHSNAKARVSYLEKAYPQLSNLSMDEKVARNPSVEHVRKYPASAHYVEVQNVDLEGIIHDTTQGGLVSRMEKAVKAIDTNVAEFENVSGIIQSKLDEIAARQLVMDGRIEDIKGDEITALRHNDGLAGQQRVSERAMNLSKDRWVKETISNIGSTIILIKTGGLIPGINALDGNQSTRLMTTAISRASGYKAVSNNEVDYQKALIEELEARKIDTSKFPNEIRDLALTIQQVANSAPVQKIFKDENQARTLIEGYLRQRILKSGLENARALDEYAVANGLASVDALLSQFEKGDGRLYQALGNLCHGHANSNDMAVLLADSNALKGDLAPHEKALKRFVERVVKENIGHYMTRASQIDVIDDLKLINFKTMDIDPSRSNAELVQGMHEQTAEQMGRQQVDAATKLALTSMFSSQFGVTHIGQYDVTRMFNFYLHRHGNQQLIASELHDGAVSDEDAPKKLSALDGKTMRGFVERTKASASRNREDQPDVGDLFLRVCGYEYFLPQAVITSGRGNRFKENPEAPVAYPMVNNVIQQFIEKLSFTDVQDYRGKVGEELDNVIAQTFIDFFHQLGREHTEKFGKEREYLRDAHANDNYGVRFVTYEDKITDDAIAHFPKFLEIYKKNLENHLTVMPEVDAALLKEQIHSLDKNVKEYLEVPAVHLDGFKAKELARSKDHRGTNMTEQWQFG